MLTAHQMLGERIARHGFADRPAADVAAAARLVCGIQAQDAAAARLGVRARAAAVTDDDVLAAVAEGRVVRTWLMRNTVHLVPAEDVRWMTALLGPMIQRRFQSVRWPQLGLTPDVLDSAAAMAPSVLQGRELTRQEFAGALSDRGVPIDRTGQAPTHALVYLSAIGLTCRATDRGRDATFALLDDWVPDRTAGPRGDAALAELARRFFRAFSPAVPADFTTWSGLPSTRAVALIRDELTPVEVDGRSGFRLGSMPPAAGLRLLPAFDNYLVGYKKRPFISDDRRTEVYVGGVIRPTVLFEGRVIGRWLLQHVGEVTMIKIFPFVNFTLKILKLVAEETEDVGRFLGTKITHSVV